MKKYWKYIASIIFSLLLLIAGMWIGGAFAKELVAILLVGLGTIAFGLILGSWVVDL